MVKIQEIREIIKMVDESDMQEFAYESNDLKISIKKSGDVSNSSLGPSLENIISNTDRTPIKVEESRGVEPSQLDQENVVKILSPMVGTFYSKPNPEAKSFVQVGEKVRENDVVCILEAMKLFNEIEAEVSGEIIEVLIEDGQLVEYGEPLFLIKKD